MKFILYTDYMSEAKKSYEYLPMIAKSLEEAIEEADRAIAENNEPIYLTRIMKKVGKVTKEENYKREDFPLMQPHSVRRSQARRNAERREQIQNRNRRKPERKNNMKYTEMMKEALNMIQSNDEIMMNLVDELDSWNGYADGFRAYDMCELYDFYCGVSATKLLDDLTADFNKYDNWFYFSIYGLESTEDKAALYRDNIDEGELLDEAIEHFNNLWIEDGDFRDLLESIVNYTEDDEAEEESILAGIGKDIASALVKGVETAGNGANVETVTA